MNLIYNCFISTKVEYMYSQPVTFCIEKVVIFLFNSFTFVQ